MICEIQILFAVKQQRPETPREAITATIKLESVPLEVFSREGNFHNWISHIKSVAVNGWTENEKLLWIQVTDRSNYY